MPTLRKTLTKKGKERWNVVIRDMGYQLLKKVFDTEQEAKTFLAKNYPMLVFRDPRARLDLEKRQYIEKSLKQGMPIIEIARALGFTYKGIRQEIDRNDGIQFYTAESAEQNSAVRLPKNNYDRRIQALEMHIEILFDEIKTLKGKLT